MSIAYPRGEIVWVSYYNSEHTLLFILTSKVARDYYYLYEFSDGGFKKLGKAKTPQELEEKFKVHERIAI